MEIGWGRERDFKNFKSILISKLAVVLSIDVIIRHGSDVN